MCRLVTENVEEKERGKGLKVVNPGSSGAGEEEMEDHIEMEQDSTSNVTMFVVHSTFIPGTADSTGYSS